jgi:tRNA 2-thiouridine synthesizing protein A
MIISELDVGFVFLSPARGDEIPLCAVWSRSGQFIMICPVQKEADMVDVIKEDQVLDCSGMLCPMPVVKTSKAIKAMEMGQVLKMIATDPGAPPDMEAWSRQTGNELLRSMQEDGKFVFYIRRNK